MDNYRILVVDDTPAIHRDFRKILTPDKQQLTSQNLQKMDEILFGDTHSSGIRLPPFEIDSAFQSSEAIDLVAESKKINRPYALAFVDVQMLPGMDGVFAIKKMWEIDPNIQIVICTAYAQYSWADLMKHLGESDHLFVLKKPFDQIEVLHLATSLTKRWNLNRTVAENGALPTIAKDTEQSSGFLSAKEKFEQAVEALKKLNRGLDKHKEP